MDAKSSTSDEYVSVDEFLSALGPHQADTRASLQSEREKRTVTCIVCLVSLFVWFTSSNFNQFSANLPIVRQDSRSHGEPA